MSRLYRIAKIWNTTKISDEERNELKTIVSKLVEYPCKIACDYDAGLVDIHVFSEEAGRVTDWLDLQFDGAFGLIEDLYRAKKRPLNKALQERCNEYNEDNDVVYGKDEDDEDSGESDEDEDEGEDEKDEDGESDASSVSVNEGK
jgi:hypothetical protein